MSSNSNGKTWADFFSENKALVWFFMIAIVFFLGYLIYNKWNVKYEGIVLSPPILEDTIGKKNTKDFKDVKRQVQPLKKPSASLIDTTKAITLPPKIAQNGKNIVNIEGDNKGNVSVGDVYNKPPQRHVLPADLEEIYEYLPDKNTKIKVVSNGSLEGNKFQEEILSELSKNGYNNLVKSVVSMSMNYFREERLTIRKGAYGSDSWIEIVINPQE